MAKRHIITGDVPALRHKSRPVETIDGRILTILDDMVETMRDADGCGLAAPQIGVLRRMCVVETDDGLFTLINPEILSEEGEQREVEGCLSIPGESGVVVRPMKIRVKALDRDGAERIYDAEGLTARAFRHEIDHLDGVLYIDKVLPEEPPVSKRKSKNR